MKSLKRQGILVNLLLVVIYSCGAQRGMRHFKLYKTCVAANTIVASYLARKLPTDLKANSFSCVATSINIMVVVIEPKVTCALFW